MLSFSFSTPQKTTLSPCWTANWEKLRLSTLWSHQLRWKGLFPLTCCHWRHFIFTTKYDDTDVEIWWQCRRRRRWWWRWHGKPAGNQDLTCSRSFSPWPPAAPLICCTAKPFEEHDRSSWSENQTKIGGKIFFIGTYQLDAEKSIKVCAKGQIFGSNPTTQNN